MGKSDGAFNELKEVQGSYWQNVAYGGKEAGTGVGARSYRVTLMELAFLPRDDVGLEFDGNDDGEKWMDLRDIWM